MVGIGDCDAISRRAMVIPEGENQFMNLRTALWGVAIGSLTLLPCDFAHASDGPSAFSLGPNTSEIWGGEPTDTCEWPTIWWVTPRIVGYAT